MELNTLKLPAAIVSPADLARAKRDLSAYNDQLQQSELRTKKTGKAKAVHAGQVINELAALNELDLAKEDDRTQLLTRVEDVQKNAPTVTISFAVDPSAVFMTKIVDWLRLNTNPQVLVRIGLRPNIAAGCILRTGSKLYDFSLRHKLDDQRELLIKGIRESANGQSPMSSTKAGV